MLRYNKAMDNKALLGIVRRTCNCVDSRLLDHGLRVSYLVSGILGKLGGYSDVQKRDICILALLHDIGAYKTEEINSLLKFDTGNVLGHSVYGYLFVKHFTPLRDMADAILFHHTPWTELRQMGQVDESSKKLAQIINIADRMDIYGTRGDYGQKEWMGLLEKKKGKQFMPELVDVVRETVSDGWRDQDFEADQDFSRILYGTPFSGREIQEYLETVIFTIDFRSNHTVNHTITTTSISLELAQRIGLKRQDQEDVVCGALLHDLGKIGIPVEILEFPGKLSPQAMDVMKTHVEKTGEILGDAVDERVRRIAMRHHEKLDGTGYPRGIRGEDLTVEERVVAVADIVSALAGTRSYKEAFARERVIGIIESAARDCLIDPDIVKLMVENYDEIMARTEERCGPMFDVYRNIQGEYEQMLEEYR